MIGVVLAATMMFPLRQSPQASSGYFPEGKKAVIRITASREQIRKNVMFLGF
jgi:hypothetical protein